MYTVAINPRTYEVLALFQENATNETFNEYAEGNPKAFIERLDNFTIDQLTAIHNKLRGTGIKKFSTKTTAIERVSEDIVDGLDDGSVSYFVPGEPQSAPIHRGARAAGAALSWKDAEVAEKRSQRHKVSVAGVEYRSVGQAFKDLGLPLKHHIKFRRELKEIGSHVYVDEDGKKYEFALAS